MHGAKVIIFGLLAMAEALDMYIIIVNGGHGNIPVHQLLLQLIGRMQSTSFHCLQKVFVHLDQHGIGHT